MGSCITKPFIAILYGKQKRIITRKQFQACKNMEQLIRLGAFFPITRIVYMKTSDRGVFPWDSPTIYPELEITVEDLYGMRKTYKIEMIALYR